MWCVENVPFEAFAEGQAFEDIEEFEQQEFVEGKSLMHALFPIQLHFNYIIYFIACIKLMGPYD